MDIAILIVSSELCGAMGIVLGYVLRVIQEKEQTKKMQEKCPICKKGNVIKKPYTKGVGYFYQCNYCGAVK